MTCVFCYSAIISDYSAIDDVRFQVNDEDDHFGFLVRDLKPEYWYISQSHRDCAPFHSFTHVASLCSTIITFRVDRDWVNEKLANLSSKQHLVFGQVLRDCNLFSKATTWWHVHHRG